MAWKKLVLKPHIIHRRHNGDTIPCQKCEKPLEAGDEAWSHSLHHKNARDVSEYFCLGCYDKLWI